MRWRDERKKGTHCIMTARNPIITVTNSGYMLCCTHDLYIISLANDIIMQDIVIKAFNC